MSWTHAPSGRVEVRTAQKAHQYALKRLGILPKLPSKGEMLRIYQMMLRIREFEQRAWEGARQGKSLPIHPSTGHEAIAVGVCSLLTEQDRIVSNHRPFGHFIAKGGSVRALMAELYGKSSGVCRGLGGEMILSEPSDGFVISSMIVGACLTIATGVGLAIKMKARNSVAVCFFGEAASTNGAFLEALTMASLYRAPVLFVCENNGYSANSQASEYLPTDLVVHRASGYGFPTTVVDGTDILAVREASQKAIWHIKHRNTPYLIEALTARIGPHKQILVDSRTPDRARSARMRDPITRFRSSLLSEGILDEKSDILIRKKVKSEVEDAVAFARRGKTLSVGDLSKYVYSDEDSAFDPQLRLDRG